MPTALARPVAGPDPAPLENRAGDLPRTEATCLEEEGDFPLAEIGADGKVHGLPKEHVGPMRVAANPTVEFAQAAVAIKHLQRLGGRLVVVAMAPGDQRVGIPISLENELSCFPLPAEGNCKQRPPRPLAEYGIIGALSSRGSRPTVAPLTIQVSVLGAQVQVHAEGRSVRVPLTKLESQLRTLTARPGRAVTIYLNATGRVPWQTVVTAMAISHCYLQARPERGFDAVLLGSPAE